MFLTGCGARAVAGFLVRRRSAAWKSGADRPYFRFCWTSIKEDLPKVHRNFPETLARWAMIAVVGSLAGLAAPSILAEDAPYEDHIQCDTPGDARTCKIDLWLMRGYRAFSQCQVCHGLGGAGSTIGPSLLDKLEEIDHARFMEVVIKGMQGPIGIMPGWENNPNVMKYVDQLYAYLKARSEGVLPGGKIKRFDR
jgi:mono/diheme cytochrome c family protein